MHSWKASSFLLLLTPSIITNGIATPSYIPVVPPSYPLAVRNPYLSAWMPGNQVSSLPTATPQFWTGQDLTLAILARINGTVYKLFGAPGSLAGALEGSVVSASYTATHSVFTLTAGEATISIDFFSPVSPKNYLRQSLPFSYITVSVSSAEAQDFQIYLDIDEWWTGQSGSTISNFTSSGGVSMFQLSVDGAYTYSESSDMALWGEAVLAVKPSSTYTATYGAGAAATVQGQFASNGTLDLTTGFTDGGVVAFSYDLGSVSNSSVTFAVGYVREAAVNYLGNARTGYYRASYPDTLAAVSYFFDDYTSANSESSVIDETLDQKAVALAGTNYSDIIALTPRQAFGGTEITIPNDSLNTSDIMVFLKEISSDGNVNTMDVIFPAFPIYYVMNPDYIRLLLEPIMQYLATGLWTQDYMIHDIGTNYPNATGHNDQSEENMPVEESGNLDILTYAYATATLDYTWATEYESLFLKYNNYLKTSGLNESVQLATNDCCGALANQTNLAIKAAIGLNAYGKLFNDSSYSEAGLDIATQLFTDGLALDEARTHFKLQYGDDVEFGNNSDYAVVFNIYADILLDLNTFPSSAFTMLAEYYPTIQGEAGVPLDSRVDWSSTFWTSWAAAASPGEGNDTRNMFIDDIWAYMTNGLNTPPFSDRWHAVPGGDGLIGGTGDVVGTYDEWRNRPVVGGHFAMLALEGPSQF